MSERLIGFSLRDSAIYAHGIVVVLGSLMGGLLEELREARGVSGLLGHDGDIVSARGSLEPSTFELLLMRGLSRLRLHGIVLLLILGGMVLMVVGLGHSIS